MALAVFAVPATAAPLRAAPSARGATARQAGHASISAGTAIRRLAFLTPKDPPPTDAVGDAVAVSGTTELVGAPEQKSSMGAAYLFTKVKKTWPQQALLTASDGVAGDRFGASVALAGPLAVVGATGQNGSTGVAYVFADVAGTWTQQAELTAPDGAPGDLFGSSVATDGTSIVVGAPGHSGSTGAAYVFTGSGNSWSEQAELTAGDGQPGDDFGTSVAVSGSTAVVGASGQNGGTGVVYVFTGSGSSWTQQAELLAPDGAAGDLFGSSVSSDGSTFVVGAPGHNGGAGAAYVFTGPGGSWSLQQELSAGDGASGDGFGTSVAISGTTVVVGSPAHAANGAAYVFTGPGGSWSQQAELTASDGAAGDRFGAAVGVSGTTAVVGAPGHMRSGAAYVFVNGAGTWTRKAELRPPTSVPGGDFGSAVSTTGSTAIVGAPGHSSSTGAAYVFTGSGNSWSEQAELTAGDGQPGDDFGTSVAVSGSTAVVGASGQNGGTGVVYVFTGSGSSWTQQAELLAPDGAAGDLFGSSVSSDGSTFVVGAPGHNGGAGAAYVFTGPGGSWSLQQELSAGDGASGDGFGTSVAISGTTVVVGSPAHAANGAAYVFTGPGGSWSQQAELTASDGAAGDRFGAAVGVSDTAAVVAAPDHGGVGAAYVFTESSGVWSSLQEIHPTDGAAGDHFGEALALTDDNLVVGAPEHLGTGAVYVYGLFGVYFEIGETSGIKPASVAGDGYGAATALSGTTAFVGAPNRKGKAHASSGAVYVAKI